MADNFYTSPGWFKATDQERALVTDSEFNARASNSAEYKNATPEKRDAIRAAYQQIVEAEALQSPNNPRIAQAQEAQTTADNQGFFGNFTDKLLRSHGQGVDLIPLAHEALLPDGSLNEKFFSRGAKYFQKREAAPRTEADKRLDADVTSRIKAFNHGGLAEKVQAAFGLVGDALSNPEGLAYLGADSAASITAMLLGAKSGALVGGGITAATGGTGAITIPVTTAMGTIAASTAHSGAQEFMDLVQKDLDANKIPYTEANIKAYYEENPERIKQHQEAAFKYGATMGVADAALGAVGGKIATLPERAAVRSARATAMAPTGKAAIEGIAQTTGKSIDDATALFINTQARDSLATQTFKSKLGHKSAGLVAEVVSEPATEALASAASGKEITAKDLVMETLGGIGAGPYGAAVNTSIFGTKVAAEETKNFTKKILASTPESRALAKEQEAEIKAAKKQRQAPADYNYKKEVAETDPTDPKVSEWADPLHAAYNPVKAVEVMAKAEDPDVELVDKARAVQNEYRTSILQLSDQIQELGVEYTTLTAAKDSRAINVENQIKALNKLSEEKQGTFAQIAVHVSKIKEHASISAQIREVKPIDPETATQTEVVEHITTSLGSHSSNIIQNDNIAKLLQRPGISTEESEVLKAQAAVNTARAKINERVLSGKSMDEVSRDIYHGRAGEDFVGIDEYHQGIRKYLTAGNIAKATEKLGALTKFRDAHQLKHDQLTELYEAYQKGGIESFSPEQAKVYAELIKNKTIRYINDKSGDLINNIGQEAAALNAEVRLAESLLKVSESKSKATTPPIVNKSTTANPAASVITPPPVIPASEVKEVKAAKLNQDSKSIVEPKEVLKSKVEITEAKDTIEINESTVEEIPDSLAHSSTDELTVTYKDIDGSEVTKPYSDAMQAMQEIEMEIKEAEAILKCFGSK